MKRILLIVPVWLKRKSLLVVVLLIAVSVSSLAVIRHNKTKKTNASIDQFWTLLNNNRKHDNALLAMNRLINVTEELQKHFSNTGDKHEWDLNSSAINVESFLRSLKRLEVNKDTRLQNLLLACELTRDFFDQEAKLAIERSVWAGCVNTGLSIDPSAAVRIRMCELQNDKNICKATDLIQENVGPFFKQQKKYLDELETDVLFSKIFTKFSAPLRRYQEQAKIMDASQIKMQAYEWIIVNMYLAMSG